jgi:hypothetical protein
MKQGTKSWLYGCHSIVHSFIVIRAWHKLYKSYPNAWQFSCIFIHDIGICGRQYIDNPETKKGHWELGALIAGKIFGEKGYQFIAGHTSESGKPHSLLYKPDKLSQMIAPRWWQLLVAKHLEPLLHEPEYKKGMTPEQAVDNWRKTVRESIESGNFIDSHELYMNRRKLFEK